MGSYLRILTAPHLGSLLGSSILARMPIGINSLATVLFLRDRTGSFAVAGLAAGAEALGAAAGAPLAARLVDRTGPRALIGLAAVHAAGLIALVILGVQGAPATALVAAALLAGAALPPTSSVLRAMYPALIGDDEDLQRSAFALDSVLTETIFLVGPLITAALVATADPAAALVVSAAAVSVGTTAFVVALPAAEESETTSGAGVLGALTSPGIRTLVLAMLPVGFGLGAVEIAVPAFAQEHGRPELAGVLMAVWSLGSLGGGLVYGSRTQGTPVARTHLRVALLLPLGLLALVAAGPIWSMALLVIPAGLFIAPLLASRNELAGRLADTGSRTEALTWPLTALIAGASLGTGTGGALVQASDWRAAALLGAVSAAIGATVALARRATLLPAARPV